MGTHDGTQKGQQEHAEGQHGEKTRARFLEQLHEGSRDKEPEADQGTGNALGKHRLREGRQQHDEADKNSEKNRLLREFDKANVDQNESDDPSLNGGKTKRAEF